MRTKLLVTLGGVVSVLVSSLVSVSFAVTAPVVTVLTPPVSKGLAAPVRVAVDSKGDMFVSDPRSGGVSKFSSSGQNILMFKTGAPPAGIALNDAGNLLVSQGDSVAIYDQSGVLLGRLGSGIGQFRKANGIAVDTAGFAYVVDSLANNVKVFNSLGQFVRTIGTEGTAAGQFSMPTGIAYDKSAKQIAVADTQNGRVQFFGATGNFDFVKSIGSFGVLPLQFKMPVGVAFEYDAAGKLSRMYVADIFQNTIQVIDPVSSGSFLSYIGKNGLANGQLMIPMDVAFDQFQKRLVIANGSGSLALYGIDGGLSPVVSATVTLEVDPVPTNVRSATITISGKVDSAAKVTVTTNTVAVAAPVVYTSATNWKCTLSGLVPGDNVLNIKAANSTGSVSRHSIGVTYTP
jgi:DNA-binding beta-propeller fold protein YncE